MEKLLPFIRCKKSTTKAESIAVKIREASDSTKSLEEQIEQIRPILDKELERDEYFVIVDENGFAYIHTNRLREGTAFTDKVGLAAARTDTGLLQVYPRDSGEVLIDASCPLFTDATGKRFNIRMGRLVHRPFIGLMFTILTAISSIIPALIVYLSSKDFLVTGSVFIATALISFIFSLIYYNIIMKRLREWYAVTKKISSGDLSAHVEKVGTHFVCQG